MPCFTKSSLTHKNKVSNSGEIKEETIANMFELETEKNDHGIGLSIIKNILDEIHGDINFITYENSVFCSVTLPKGEK
ncbi:MAG: GHKL domain-containing protein [Lactobacillales bacterium]|nr:GHKL domain-containing protein [Lactobacillales bacterium]